MDKENEIILVTGATGHQGGAVARNLLTAGWRVRALVRNPNDSRAQALANMGVEVVQGDLHDRASIDRALTNVYGVFSMQNWAEQGVDDEVYQGNLLADAADAVGVDHFVYSSVAAADQDTGISFFESKWQIEQHIRSIDLPATILRPVFFMENLLAPSYLDSIRQGTLSLPLRRDTILQMIAVEDIGMFVAMAFDRPEESMRQTLDIASDELSMQQVTDELSYVLGKQVDYVESSLDELRRQNRDYAQMFDWINQNNLMTASMASLRLMLPSPTSFRDWLQKSDVIQKLHEEISAGMTR